MSGYGAEFGSIYDMLARKYDLFNEEVDHAAMAEFFLRGAKKFSKAPKTALDLCCGTGSMLLALCEKGIDMQGVDLSADMLAVARDRVSEAGYNNVLLLCQDMRSFELYGTVDAITCCLDSLNHLSSAKELKEVFALVCNYLEYGGVFYFDLNSKYKYENVYGNNCYVLEDEGTYCGWQNFYDPKSGKVDFVITVFEEQPDGSYTRRDAVQREKCFSERTVRSALKAAGLELCGIYGDTDFSPPTEESERLYFFAKRPYPAK